MQERLQPYVPAFNAAITCCGAARHWQRANLLLGKMKEVMAQAPTSGGVVSVDGKAIAIDPIAGRRHQPQLCNQCL